MGIVTSAQLESVGFNRPQAELLAMAFGEQLADSGLATKDDLKLGLAEVHREIAKIHKEIAEIRKNLETGLAGVDVKLAGVDVKFAGMDAKFAEVRKDLEVGLAEMDVKFAEIRKDLEVGLAEVRASVDKSKMEMSRLMIGCTMALLAAIIALALGT